MDMVKIRAKYVKMSTLTFFVNLVLFYSLVAKPNK
ncbi:hypothetical protein M2408_003765 [Sphingobacterium sp. BIGb0165]|nr:hypothetical protein [Sphingobacterium sp. BIGb0165]